MSQKTADDYAREKRAELVDFAKGIVEATKGDDQTRRTAAVIALEKEHPDLPSNDVCDIIEVAAGKAARRIEITWARDIAPENVEWLWQDRIPVGMISGLYGVEGMGKSMETIRIAAAVSRGELPGDREGSPQRVLFATTEDTWAHVVTPRLLAAGADMSMVGQIRIRDEGGDEGMEIPRDAGLLGAVAAEHDVGLVILDPVVSHLEGKADSHQVKDVRKALEPLSHIAETAGFAVLGIMHFNKAKSTDTRQRGQMSSAFREVFRSTLVFGPDPDRIEDKSARVVALDKNNLVAPQPAYRMRIEGVTLKETDSKGQPIKTAKIVKGEECSYTAEELLEAAAGVKPRALSEQGDEARTFLMAALQDGGGVCDVGDTKDAAAKAGITKTALDNARKALRLGSRRATEGNGWEWFDREAAGEVLAI